MTTFKIGINGGMDFDNSNQASPKAKGTVTLTGLSDLISQMSQSSGSSSGIDMSGIADQISSYLKDMEFVSVDKKVYVKLAGTWDDLGDAASASSDLGGLGALGGVSGLGGVGGSTGTSTNAADTQCIENAMKDPAKFSSDKMFKNLSEAGSEKIDGVDTTHFKADIDMDKTIATLTELGKSCGQPEAAGGLEGSTAQMSKLFKTLNVELWIEDRKSVV